MHRDTTRFCITVYVLAALLVDAAYQVHISVGGTRLDRKELASTLFFFCIWLPLIPLIVRIAKRFPLIPGRRLRALEVHFFAAFAFSFLTLFAHKLVFCSRGPHYIHCITYYRAEAWMARWFALDYFIYTAVVAGILAIELFDAIQRREVHASMVERELASAELRLMTSQLRPDSLISMFRSIAGHVGTEPMRAERRITLLADFLRLNVRAVGASDLTVADDIDLLRSWIDMEREGGIDVEIDVDPSIRALPIVASQLQPLVAEKLPQAARRVTVRGEGKLVVVEADGIEIVRVEIHT